MNIITKLTLRYLKENRQRTFTTIIGVVISVAMIVAVPTLLASMIDLARRQTVKENGDWHVSYSLVLAKDLELIRKDESTSSIALSQPIGFSPLEESLSYNKTMIYFTRMDEKAMNTYHVALVEGRLPEAENEIAWSSSIASEGGVIQKVGDEIEVVIGDRIVPADEKNPERVLSREDYTAYSDNTGEVVEVFRPRETHKFLITGIIDPGTLENYPAIGFLAMQYLDADHLEPTDLVDVAVKWKQIDNGANKNANRLLTKLKINAEQIDFNHSLLRYYGILSDRNMAILYGVGTILLVLIIVGSVALIYNAFAISVVERSRQFGILSSVGATRFQKRSAILQEAFLIGLIAIPIGLAAGTAGIGLTMRFLEPLFEGVVGTSSEPLRLVFSPGALVTSVIIALITLLISAWIPSKHAGSVTPIESIRMTQDLRIKPKDVNTSDLTRHLFGFEAELGLKNLKRNRKRYSVIIFSLVISIVLFLAVSSFTIYGDKAADHYAKELKYPVWVSVHSDVNVEKQVQILSEIARLEGVTDSMLIKTVPLDIQLEPEQINPVIRNTRQPEEYAEFGGNTPIAFAIQLLGQADFDKFLAANKISELPQNDQEAVPVVLINSKTLLMSKDKYQPIDPFFVERGETLEAAVHLRDGITEDKVKLKIAAIAAEMPNGDVGFDLSPHMLLVGVRETFDRLAPPAADERSIGWVYLQMNAADTSKLTNDILAYQNTHPVGGLMIQDINAYQRAERNIKVITKVFSYGFVILITLVGIANIYNTVMTSVAQRKQEFAMLRAVGMTSEGLKKMIRYESLFYGFRALIIGLLVGTGINYLLFRQISEGFRLKFQLPWLAILIVIVVMMATVGLTTLSASNNATKDSIVEALKNENY